MASMAVAHGLCNGIGGMRTTGDLVGRMQFARSMKIDEAKDFVAKKLEIDKLQLTEECLVRDLREELGIGVVTGLPNSPKGLPAKMNIEKLLGITISTCEHFRQQTTKYNKK